MSAHRQTLNEPIVVFAPDRPALALLIKAMERRLSQRQRIEIARHGRKAKAAKQPWVRRLTRGVTAEIRRLAAQQAAE